MPVLIGDMRDMSACFSPSVKVSQCSQQYQVALGNKKPYIVVPYVKGRSESHKNICRKHEIEMYFKGGNTIKNLQVHSKTETPSYRRVE